ncbi:MAG: hypothetical protein F6K09_05005 [Merismopedia sp. SIO2A8]|nr:hypothetical protein [Merismopedia sp. SIO2A8]
MRLKKSITILLVGVGIAIATLFATIFGGTKAIAETCQYHPEAYSGLEMSQLTQELEGSGLIGRIHGASAVAKMVVLSVREPNNFFAHREFSLIADDEELQTALATLHRHDQVCINGEILANPSPQMHIAVSSIEVMEPWTGLDDYPDYDYDTEVPDELANQSSVIAKVHAIGAGGHIVVVEYKDRVLPIFVESPETTQSLYRGDVVRLAYTIQQQPDQPMHLKLDSTVEQPIEVMDAIALWHGEEKTLSGHLVKFPQSPQLRFDVYALEVDAEGVKRNFTLLNFEDMEVFQGIRDKLAQLWDDHEATAIPGRNYLVNPDLVLQATGIINVISPEQANPQILLDSADAIRPQS